jgi:3-hydroxyisobutyrate dehydrogenase-like beta-hydroxyacid dehydrogenase
MIQLRITGGLKAAGQACLSRYGKRSQETDHRQLRHAVPTNGAALKAEPAGFKMTLGLKDIKLALAAAESLNVPLPIASLVRDHFLSGLAQGQGDSDWAALARISVKNSGRAMP